MPAKSPAAAVEAYRARASRLLSCLTPAHVDVGGGYAPCASPHALVMAGNDSVALRGASRLTLAVSEHYFIVDARRGLAGPTRRVFLAVGRQDAGELLAFQWHPRGKSPIVTPHLHVRANIEIGERWLGKVHLPTGNLVIEDMVRLVIQELSAEPVREDWEALVAQRTQA